MSQLTELRGRFRRLAWAAKGDGRRFCIASIEAGESDKPEDVSVKGECDPNELIHDLEYRFYGRWETSNKYGKQFAFKQLKRSEPHSRVSVIGYLKQFATGIGPVYAAQLWDAFGPEAVRVLRTDPTRAATVVGIPMSKAKDASAALNRDGENEDLRLELVQLFEGRHFPKKLIEVVIKLWGLSAPERIRKDPFTLMVNRLPGCGFARCDQLYVDLGLPMDRLKRQFFCIWKALQADGEGHTWYPMEVAAAAVQAGVSGLAVGQLNWNRAVRLGVRAGWLKARKDDAGKWWLAESRKADNEASVAADMLRILRGGEDAAAWPDPDAIEGLASHHREQLRIAFRGRFVILTGDPGTGKTTAASLVLRAVRETIGAGNICVCTQTNLAAQRLTSVLESFDVRDIPVTTFHRLLAPQRNGRDGGGWGFFYHRRNRLNCKLFVIDEDSMRDIDISASLFEAIPDGCLVLCLGDTNQLPPVGHGAPLRDGIAAGLPRGHFSEVLRNSGSITRFCEAARVGRRPVPPPYILLTDEKNSRNWKHVECSSTSMQVHVLKSMLASLGSFELGGKPIDPIRDSQILVALNEKGDLARTILNAAAQAILNPHGAQADGNPFRLGDKVICGDNCYLKIYTEDCELAPADDDDAQEEWVANGQIGFVTHVEKRFSVVDLPSGVRVRVPVARGDGDANGSFDLAYAITIHKSQGSQWPIVFMLSDRAANRMGSRELWNTGGSRPTKLLVTIGELSTIERQCQRVALRDRKTFLKEMICDG